MTSESNNTIPQEQNQKIIKKRKIVIRKTETATEMDENVLQKLGSYVEPVYPITKKERFDEDNMKSLLRDTNFNKKDRDRLTEYNKKRYSGGEVSATYKLAAGCEEYQLGRLFPQDGVGLQSYCFDREIHLLESITGISILIIVIIESQKKKTV